MAELAKKKKAVKPDPKKKGTAVLINSIIAAYILFRKKRRLTRT